jgi:hypothetical protein
MNTSGLLLSVFTAATALLNAAQDDAPRLTIGPASALPVYDKVLLQPDTSSTTRPLPSFDVVDFNQDGRLDLVIAEAAGAPFRPEPPFVAAVYLQTQRGGFERQPISYPLPVENRLRGVFVRDFNRDGHLDLLVSDYLRDLILVLANGNGTFAQPQPLGIAAAFPTVADLNNDTVPDVVVATPEGGVSVLLSSGDGGLVLSQALDTVIYPDRGSGQSLVADVNRDGHADILVCSVQNFNSSTGSLDVFLGKGDGTFQEVIRTENVATWRGALADFNNDGNLDFAGTRKAPLGVEIWLGRGNGHFAKGRTYATANNYDPQFVATGDLNGDGIVDLLVTQTTTEPRPTTLAIRLGNGDGTFQPWIHYTPYPGYVTADVEPKIRDLNGDGRLDIITHALRSDDFASRVFAVGLAQNPLRDGSAFIITMKGATNKPAMLETSQDLASWTPVATNAPLADWSLVQTSGAARSFYRVRAE